MYSQVPRDSTRKVSKPNICFGKCFKKEAMTERKITITVKATQHIEKYLRKPKGTNIYLTCLSTSVPENPLEHSYGCLCIIKLVSIPPQSSKCSNGMLLTCLEQFSIKKKKHVWNNQILTTNHLKQKGWWVVFQVIYQSSIYGSQNRYSTQLT